MPQLDCILESPRVDNCSSIFCGSDC